MSIKPVWGLWIYLNIRRPRRFVFWFVLPFTTLLMLLDMLDDAVQLKRLFFRGKEPAWIGKHVPGGSIEAGMELLKAFFFEAFLRTGPFDLVDVDAASGGERVRVKCALR